MKILQQDIEATHPVHTHRHDIYTVARRLVSERFTKGNLVELVNFLLVRIEHAEQRDTLTEEQLCQALQNIGFDLACGECACLFYTGHGGVYEHSTDCRTTR